MNARIGVIGAAGDLGSQLCTRLRERGMIVMANDPALNDSVPLRELLKQCDIIHICAPLEMITDLSDRRADTIFILHDSVMAYSHSFNNDRLQNGAAIVHMLMNEQRTVVVASDAPHADDAFSHMMSIGLDPHMMSIKEHDILMAKSQAPLALLLGTLIPYLYDKESEGLLTPSGQLLANTLKSREIMWTPATVESILRNPQLGRLIEDMQATLTKVGYNKGNE